MMGKSIDSGVYEHVWRELIEDPQTDRGELSASMLLAPLAEQNFVEESRFFLARFAPDSKHPLSCSLSNNLATHALLGQAWLDLLGTLTHSPVQPPSADSPARSRAGSVLRLLLHCCTPSGSAIMHKMGCVDHALLVAFFESALNAGLSPNATEGQIKRAAHLQFGLMRKKMYSASAQQCATIAGLLWTARINARSTEGIAEQRLAIEQNPLQGQYDLGTPGAPLSLALLHSLRPPVALFIDDTPTRPPGCAHTLDTVGNAGIELKTESGPLSWSRTSLPQPVRRKHLSGWRFEYNGFCAEELYCTLKTVILLLENTVYRVDILSTVQTGAALFDCSLTLPHLEEIAPAGTNRWESKGRHRSIVDFTENPLGLSLVSSAHSSTVFAASIVLSQDTPVQTICAWSSGEHLTDINRTTLLGIYDL